MGTEIERKFLVRGDRWREKADDGIRLRQGYLSGSERSSVRVRIEGGQANINIKSGTLGIRRQEYEYPIPLADAEEILDTLCEKPLIEKTRFHVTHDDQVWEVDVFEGDNAGLVVVELEMESEDAVLNTPDWVGEEVSHDRRYYNVCLVKHPFKDW